MNTKMPNSRRNLDIAIDRIFGASENHLQLHHQIAQKLHALSAEGSERAHDMIDLQIICSNEKVDFSKTKNACERLFAFRKQQSWPPRIVKGVNWETLYESQVNELDVQKKIDEAINWTNDLVKVISNS